MTERFTTRDLAAAAVMNLMWGLNIIAVKMGVDATAPFAAGAIRQAIVLAVCLPFLRVMPGKMRELIGLGLLSGGVFYIFVNWSLAVATNVSALAIAGQVGVPFALILGIAFLGERIRLAQLAGIALSFGGVALLVFDPRAGDDVVGIALTAAGSLIWAVSSLIQRRLRDVPVLTIYAWMGLVGLLMLAPLALLLEPDTVARLPALPLRDAGWLAFSAIGSTILGHGAMSWLLQRHPISTVTPLTLGAPVIGVVASSLFFATPLTPLMVIGGVIALAGVAIITIRTARAGEEVET